MAWLLSAAVHENASLAHERAYRWAVIRAHRAAETLVRHVRRSAPTSAGDRVHRAIPARAAESGDEMAGRPLPLDDEQLASLIEKVTGLGGFLGTTICPTCAEPYVLYWPYDDGKKGARPFAGACLLCDEAWKIPRLTCPNI
jgi:hypothetical protein